jgi:heptosyltransferase-2
LIINNSTTWLVWATFTDLATPAIIYLAQYAATKWSSTGCFFNRISGLSTVGLASAMTSNVQHAFVVRTQQPGAMPLFPPGIADPRSILVVLPTWVGDFVMATPALRAIRERFSGAQITFLLEGNLLDLARGGPWMDECVSWPDRGKRTILSREYRALVKNLRRRRFDCAVLLSNSFRSAMVTRLIGAARRVGYDRDGRGWLLTDRIAAPNHRGAKNGQVPRDLPSLATTAAVHMGTQVPGRPAKFHPIPLVEYYAGLVEALGCNRSGDALELFTTPDCETSIMRRLADLGIATANRDIHRRLEVSTLPQPLPEREGGYASPIVALSPGAKFGASKCWAPQRFAEAADRLIQECAATVMVTCGPGEEPIAQAIAGAMKLRAHVLTDPLLTLGELKSLIRRCDLLIANDAGPRHIAKAFGVPVVTVFGPTHPYWTATNYRRERIVRVDIDCGPCQQPICPLGHHQCMEAVSVDMIIAAARELLRGWAADQRR